MSKIAFLGLGAMGSRMAAKLVAAGHKVTVWNRNAAKTAILERAGANVASSPREAASGAAFIISMLRDDAASRRAWLEKRTGALAAMSSSAITIESSTLSIDWVRELAGQFELACKTFIDAPVAGSRPHADLGQLVFLAGGDSDALQRAKSVLLDMGAAVHHAGPSGAGTITKLAVNALFGIQVLAMAEVVETIRRQGFDPAQTVEIIGATAVFSTAARAAAASMLAGNFAPLFPIELVEKDFRYVMKAAGSAKAAPMAALARAIFARGIREGYGHENLTGIVQLYQSKAGG
ncbi:3-hydroxyisobutyrate dehydrogenase [Labrys miyagiensis]|uniref:3-hydroxyisobutyrate dehydrogenase n=1 Tax=Labrys miyagiensis TaxID=346912 RepID=A0ABQ6CF59_9HYPH|nr:NAD(P)-dependent oxidoreductase [Labrys miyagiensis]GLS18247.1 3-hydroxyisobutyrate dehydrogenase [Labrys miyagiensis]